MKLPGIGTFQDVASLGRLVLSAIRIAVVLVQLLQIKASIRIASHAPIYDQAADFRAYPVEHSE